MTITRYPLLIIALFSLLIMTGCAAVDDINDAWKNRNNTSSQTVQQSTFPRATETTHPTTQNATQNVYGGTGFENLPDVKVAILLPLTGSNAAVGQSMLQAAQLALFDMGYTNFNLIPRDTGGTTSGATAAAMAALNDGAQLILGPLFADSVRAVKAVAKPRNINVIAFSTDWTLADQSTFLMGFMPFSQVERVAQHAFEKGYRSYALVAPRDKYGDLVTSRFTQSINQKGGRIAKSIRFMPGDPAVINQIETLNPASGTPDFQAVFMPVGGSQIETISSALSYYKLMPRDIKRIGTGLWDDARIAAQPNMQGAWFAAPSPSARQAFEQQYQSAYGQPPVRLATLAYDATALAAILAKNGFATGNTPDFSYTALTNPNGFAGTDGVFRFQSNGLVERGLAVLELRGGRLVEVSPAPTRF